MNNSLKIVTACVTTSSQLNFLKFGLGHGQICRIHNWVRPVRYVLRRRRKVEYEKFPERAKPIRRSAFNDWNYRAELYAFGKRLGEEFDEPLLNQALIDKSYIHFEKRRLEELGLDPNSIQLQDNGELAERGKSLLEQVLNAFMVKEFPKLPKEGVEAVVQSLTSDPILKQVSLLIGTKDIIQCQDYPPSDQVYSTAFQAIVGALEQSSGLERVEKFILDVVASHLCGKDIHDFWDIPKPWHMLLDLTRPQGKTLEPRLLREAGKNTLLSVYVVGIYDENKVLMGTGVGETIDIAQEMGARDVLRGMFGTKTPLAPFHFQTDNFPMQLIPHVR
ncbi:39S ribosomal protein L44, mitochondrial [Folsomia candida]|uniref:Large ribosomal subunit protein mL44 n=1 Tax=Folsomia candida TaxID=158441 RepID=A0A226DYW4_FOLCA|nr:39S ribosomal protein L44, mitochondrial [Folsomia candida]OXA50218.1 hypothetical protein Fcan01_15247 [Folsomia candida]